MAQQWMHRCMLEAWLHSDPLAGWCGQYGSCLYCLSWDCQRLCAVCLGINPSCWVGCLPALLARLQGTDCMTGNGGTLVPVVLLLLAHRAMWRVYLRGDVTQVMASSLPWLLQGGGPSTTVATGASNCFEHSNIFLSQRVWWRA
jgi:hypothetical protein